MAQPVAGRSPVLLFMPAHNEAASVADVVARAPRDVCGHSVEVVVVDDGSTDGTAGLAEGAGASVVRMDRNRGLGFAVRTGLAVGVERRAAAVAFCDADGEYAPEELEQLVAPILSGQADYVIGSRFVRPSGGERGMPMPPRHMLPHRWLGNRTLTLGMQLLVRRWGVSGLSDGQSGYRALSAEAAEAAEVIHDFNYAQVLTLDLLAKGFRYMEVPISYRFRQHGRSFVRLLPYLRRVIPAVWRELRTDQSSTTKDRKPSRAAVQDASSNSPDEESASAAAHPIASA